MVRKGKHIVPYITKHTSRSQAAERGLRDNTEKREAEQGVESWGERPNCENNTVPILKG